MLLSRLNVHHFRNIASAKLEFNQRVNVFFGPNGSGKTSLLESIYLLGSGHSFRSRETRSLLSYDASQLTVFGEMVSGDTISIQKENAKSTVRFNQAACQRSSELARYLPCQVFYQDIFDIMDAGPLVRRGLLDWGLFHVEPDYHTVWKDYQRVVKQRNRLLREGAHKRLFEPWDAQLVNLSTQLEGLRAPYFKLWHDAFQVILSKLTAIDCILVYDKGWDRAGEGIGLDEILTQQFMQDMQRQYTQSGAHQADILFKTTGKKAKQTLSRGQQKIILIALKLAQAELLKKNCIYLFDDITTELDAAHIQRFLTVLEGVTGQFFFTSIEPGFFKDSFQQSMPYFFALEAGEVSRETLSCPV